MLSLLAGLRVGEIAHPRVRDVDDANGKVRDRILLRKAFTKGDEARTVFVSERLRSELGRFFQAAQSRLALDAPLLGTQKRTAFSPNTPSPVVHKPLSTGRDRGSHVAQRPPLVHHPACPCRRFAEGDHDVGRP